MKTISKLLPFCLLILMSISCKQNDPAPEVLQILSLTDKVGNYGYAELAQESSKWGLLPPLEKSPFEDADGSLHKASLQPVPNVMILWGTGAGNSSRNITIPSRQYVFLPLIAYTNWYYTNDKCNPTYQPAAGQTAEAFLLGGAKEFIDVIKNMTAKLDGVEIVPDLTKYRAKTKLFTMLIGKGFDDPNCDYSKQNASVAVDGYYLLLKIPKGKHTLTYNAIVPSDPTPHPADTWNLTVE